MRLDVLAQVVGSHEGLVADLAGELLLARVDPHVPVELVGSGELFAAKGELANEGLLAGVPAQMGLEVRGLAVLLAAAGMMADVNELLGRLGGVWFVGVRLAAGQAPRALQVETVGTVATGSASVTALGPTGSRRGGVTSARRLLARPATCRRLALARVGAHARADQALASASLAGHRSGRARLVGSRDHIGRVVGREVDCCRGGCGGRFRGRKRKRLELVDGTGGCRRRLGLGPASCDQAGRAWRGRAGGVELVVAVC